MLRAPQTIDSACDRKTYKAKFETAPTVRTLDMVPPTALSYAASTSFTYLGTSCSTSYTPSSLVASILKF